MGGAAGLPGTIARDIAMDNGGKVSDWTIAVSRRNPGEGQEDREDPR